MKIPRFCLPALLGVLIACDTAVADVKLPAVFGDHMLLQRDIAAPVWGWAAPGEAVTVTAGAANVSTKADANGKWMARLPAMKASFTPVELQVSGAANKVVIHDVLVGDVWMCTGQSQMGFTLKQASNAAEELPKANHPEIRLFFMKVAGALQPQSDCTGQWSVCTPDSAKNCSAIGYFFGKEIAETQKIPVALVNDNVGATGAQYWTSLEDLQSDPDLKKVFADPFTKLIANADAVKKAHDQWLANGGQVYLDARAKYFVELNRPKAPGQPEPSDPKPPSPEPPHLDDIRLPTALYNAMIAPVIPFAIKGVIWYQGDTNSPQRNLYQKLFSTLIQGWRRSWGQGDFPFLFVQLNNFRPHPAEPGDSALAELREAQLQTLYKEPNTGMAVSIDLGDVQILHPPNKAPVGHRLALIARHNVYGENIVFSSPLYKSHTVQGNKVIITFDHTGAGLKLAEGDAVKGFAIAGADDKFVWAQAKIEGPDTVSVWSDAVAKPAKVRYGWADNPEINLYNSADLPASPFRIDIGKNP